MTQGKLKDNNTEVLVELYYSKKALLHDKGLSSDRVFILI